MWKIDTVCFDGYAPDRGGATHTAWQFTVHAGGRAYTVYLTVLNRVLALYGRMQPGGPPPPELVPRLLDYVRRRLEHPALADRYPRSLAGVELPLTQRAEWEDLMGRGGAARL